MMMRILCATAVAAVLLVGPAMAGETDATPQAVVGKPAPDFSLPDGTGKMHKLSDYRGKIVVLEWTNQKCPYVQHHHKVRTMQKLAEKYADKGVVWLAIDSSYFADAEADRSYRAKMGIEYPYLYDPTGRVGRLYGAKTTPHMFVIDRDGTLVYDGAIDDDFRNPTINYVEAALEAILNGSKVVHEKTKPYGCSVKYAGAGEKPGRRAG